MKNHFIGVLFAFVLAASPAFGQLQLYVVTGASEQPAPAVYDIGKVEPSLAVSTQFRIRNNGAKPAYLDLLAVAGSGFAFATRPQIPTTLAPQQALDFLVIFQSTFTGSYSASLDSVGFSILLTATVPAELTNAIDSETGIGTRPLGAGIVDFGGVPRGNTVVRHVTLSNQTVGTLAVPQISLSGNAAFSIPGPPPSGVLLQPVDAAAFDVQFSPSMVGSVSGQLTIGPHSYLLAGNGVEPPLPSPRIVITLPQNASAQQGVVRIYFDAPSKTSGIGTVTLTFHSAPNGPADPSVAFAGGGQSASFTVAPGDTQGQFAGGLAAFFQTGTTAGTMTVTAQLGSGTDEQSIPISPAMVFLTAAQATRSSGTIEVDLTGYDNTRTAGPLTFTFYDASGKAMTPGAISTDSTSGFANYFQNSLGGSFVLKAIFPITGDTTQIKSFIATVKNGIGTASTDRIVF